ncbi:MAG: UDP-N-acetylmuramoyl-tripeptide--D-alanyl-D-alanine ligase [Clostridia bacterium]|jgi:UDP-N-acetylmuramoyl-tripeptide--D-alanyl-D-alanine ligase|nr:UDP-N-acetylmuramoyl-tripeptide--D-alanyl-D-alanine ligase [Clostridia bacterium]
MFKLKEIEEYTNGNIVCGNKDIIVENYCLTQKIREMKNYFFIPIIFRKVNRESYIIDHVKNGCIGFMIDKDSENRKEIEKLAQEINPNICIIEVESVNNAIYKLGIKCRENNIEKPIIAVTGSVGKTTLCSIISQVLKTEIKLLHDFKNENNNIASYISLSYLFPDNYDMAVTEIGISDFGKMSNLSKLVKPSIAVINSIGTAHINKLKSKENILKEKLHITDKKILFLNSDDEYLRKVNESEDYEIRYYSMNEANNINRIDGKISFNTKVYGIDTNFKLNLYQEYNIRNIILAIKIAEIYNIRYENIIRAINDFRPVDGRFKVLKNVNRDITLIDDIYSSCFESVKMGLESANKIKSKRKIAVLGTIGAGSTLEETSKIHEELGNYFNNLDFDYIYLIGDFTKHIYKGALGVLEEKYIRKFKTIELLLEDLEKNIRDGDLIYFKESGFQNFDKIIEKLKNKFDIIQ